jgi:hypothetical protein
MRAALSFCLVLGILQEGFSKLCNGAHSTAGTPTARVRSKDGVT